MPEFVNGVDPDWYRFLYPDIAASGVDPATHFAAHGDREGRSPNPLFDPVFYRAQLGVGAAPDGAWAHYVAVGAALGLDPHPLFRTAFYQRSGAAGPDADPVTDLLSIGFGAGSATPWFDADFYRARHPDIAADDIAPLAHYAGYGWRDGAVPHPLFDPAHYLAANADVAATGMDPLAHFVRHGRAEGRLPHALFDPVHYIAANPDLAAAGVDPVAHYLTQGWRESGRSVSPVFDPVFYRAANPDVAAVGAHPLGHFLTNGRTEGRAPHALFDAAHYLAANPDLAAAGVDPVAHYALHGWREGRTHHPLFDPAFYRAQNPDVAAAGADPFAHFMTHGWREGRDPSAAFDLAFYAAANPDVAAAGWNLLLHYARFGQAEGRAFAPGQLGLNGAVLGSEAGELLLGDARGNRIEGLAGDDTLAGGPGADTLVGGPGADAVVVDPAGGAVDVVEDFDPVAGDVLDLRTALTAAGYDPDAAPLADFMRVRQVDGDTVIDLRPTGAAPGVFAPAVRLAGESFDFAYLRLFGLLTEAKEESFQLISDPYGFTDTFDTTSDVAVTPDGRYVAWSDLHDFEALVDAPPFGEIGFDLVKFASLAASHPSEAQIDRQVPVAINANGDPLTSSRNASISDDGRVVGYERFQDGDTLLWVREMNVPGSTPQSVSRDRAGTPVEARLGALSGDGDHVVFLTDSAAMVANRIEGATGGFTGSLTGSLTGGLTGGLTGRLRSVPVDDNAAHDVYLRNWRTGETVLVSAVDDPGRADDGRAGGSGWTFSHEDHAPDLSLDGRWVVFVSDVALTPDDTDADRDVYLRDTQLGRTILLSGGAPGDAGQPTISRDGTVVAFTTEAALDDDDANGINDVYVARIADGAMAARFRVSEGLDGREGHPGAFDATYPFVRDGESYAPVVSPDGTAVAFVTRADFLPTARGGVEARLAVRDLETGLYGEPARDLFTSFSFEEDRGIRAPKHDLTESGDSILYRVREQNGFEDTPFLAAVDPLPGPADRPDASGPAIAPRQAERDGDSDLMFLLHGAIDRPGDRDSFRVEGFSGFYDEDDLRIVVQADHRWGGGLTDPALRLLNAEDDRFVLAQNDDASAATTDSRLVFDTRDADEGFYIEVSAADGGLGDYTLRIEAVPDFSIGIPPILVGPRLPALDPVIDLQHPALSDFGGLSLF